MADFNIDTSSYPKAAPMQQQNPLDIIGKLQGIQKQQIGISKDKLDLYNSHWDNIQKILGNLSNKPDLTSKDFVDELQKAVKAGAMTHDQYATEISSLPSITGIQRKYPNATPEQHNQILSQQLKQQAEQHLINGAERNAQINWYAGNSPGIQEVGGGFQPVQNYRGQLRATGPVVPQGLPVTTPGYIPGENREAPIGIANPTSPGLPVAGSTAPIVPKRVQTIKPPPLPIGPNYDIINSPRDALGRPQNITGPGNSVIPGNPPFGSKAATEATGVASGRALANERDIATNYQRSVFPLEQAIHSLENLGTKGTGPGTETINQLKSFILSNVPGVTEANFDGTVADFDKAKKYLTDYVNQNGNSGTNDKLAAAFAGNPSVNISNAAAKDVAKSAYSLARVRKALLQEFENSGAPENQYSRWAAQNASRYDPRAFGVDMMNNEAKKKLRNELENNPSAKRKFETSLKAAVEYGLVK